MTKPGFGDYTREGLTNITPCWHDEESTVSLLEQHGYTDEDIVACKLCLKEELEAARAEIERSRALLADIDRKIRSNGALPLPTYNALLRKRETTK